MVGHVRHLRYASHVGRLLTTLVIGAGIVCVSASPAQTGSKNMFRNLGIEPETANRSARTQTRLGTRLNQRVESRIENRIGSQPDTPIKRRNGLYDDAPFAVPKGG